MFGDAPSAGHHEVADGTQGRKIRGSIRCVPLTATAKRIGTNRPGCSQAVSVYWFTSATWQAPRRSGEVSLNRSGLATVSRVPDKIGAMS
jgi:hypothetical protein